MKKIRNGLKLRLKKKVNAYTVMMSLYRFALQLLGCMVCLLLLHTTSLQLHTRQENFSRSLIASTSSMLRLLSLQITDVLASCIRKHVQWRITNHAQGVTGNKYKHIWMPDYRMDDLVSSIQDIRFTTSKRKVFHDCTISELPPGRYMFVITEDNTISYGLMEDHWHIGVKHFHLAMRRLVVLGGELWLNVSDSVGLSSNPLNGSVLFTIRSGSFTKNIQKTLVDRLGLNQTTAIMEQCTKEVIEVLLTSNSDTPARYHYDRNSIQPHPLGVLKDDEHVVIPSVERVAEFCQFPHFDRLNRFICSYYVPWTRDELMRIRVELSTHQKKWLRAADLNRLQLNDGTMGGVPTWKKLNSVSNGSVLIYPSSSSLPHGLFVIEGRSSIFLHKHTLPNSTAEVMTNEHLVYVNGRLDACLITKPIFSDENVINKLHMQLLARKLRHSLSRVTKLTKQIRMVYRDHSRSMLEAMAGLHQDCLLIVGENTTGSARDFIDGGCALQRDEFDRPTLIRYLT